MNMRFDILDQATENECIHPDVFAVRQTDIFMAGFEEGLPDALAQRREGAAQRGAGAGGVVVRPQEGRQGIPAYLIAGKRQIGQEGVGFTGIEFHQATVALDAGRPQ